MAAGAIAGVVLFFFFQLLVTLGVLAPVFRLDPAAVEMSKAALDFLPRIAWPLAIVFVVYLFSDEIRELLKRLKRAKTPWGDYDFDPDFETPYDGGKIEGLKEAFEQGKAEAMARAVATKSAAEGTVVGPPVADPATLAQENLKKAQEALADVEKKSDELYSNIDRALGEDSIALLICLQRQADPTMKKLAAGLRFTSGGLHGAFHRLWEKSLIKKEEPRGVARPTQLGDFYLDWLKGARPDAYVSAMMRYSGEE